MATVGSTARVKVPIQKQLTDLAVNETASASQVSKDEGVSALYKDGAASETTEQQPNADIASKQNSIESTVIDATPTLTQGFPKAGKSTEMG